MIVLLIRGSNYFIFGHYFKDTRVAYYIGITSIPMSAFAVFIGTFNSDYPADKPLLATVNDSFLVPLGLFLFVYSVLPGSLLIRYLGVKLLPKDGKGIKERADVYIEMSPAVASVKSNV